MEYINFFNHPGVKIVSFSKDETHVISYNGLSRITKDYQSFRIWKVNKIQVLKSFKAMQSDSWDSIKWSSCGNYVAKIDDHCILVYSVKGDEVVLLQDNEGLRSPIKVPSIQRFEWVIGTSSIICACFDGPFRKVEKELKTRIVVIDVNTRRE